MELTPPSPVPFRSLTSSDQKPHALGYETDRPSNGPRTSRYHLTLHPKLSRVTPTGHGRESLRNPPCALQPTACIDSMHDLANQIMMRTISPCRSCALAGPWTFDVSASCSARFPSQVPVSVEGRTAPSNTPLRLNYQSTVNICLFMDTVPDGLHDAPASLDPSPPPWTMYADFSL
jgi:hypothetical protein